MTVKDMGDVQRPDGTDGYRTVSEEYMVYSEGQPDGIPEENRIPQEMEKNLSGKKTARTSASGKSPKKKKRKKKKQRKSETEQERRRKIEKRIRRKAVRKKIGKMLLILLLFLALAGIAVYLFFSSSVFLVSEIAVNHNTLKSDKQIIRESGLRIGQNIFRFKGSEVRKIILKENPYISDVRIDRKLPNRIILTVKEHTPVAAVKYKGKYLILDAGGKVVGIEKTQITATRLTGVEVTRYTMGRVPVVHNTALLEESLKLIGKVNDTGLFFKKLDVSSTLIVHGYITDDLQCTGETEDIIENLEGIKAIVYDLGQKNTMKGTIYVGKEGYATFSPVSGKQTDSSSQKSESE